MCFLFSRWPLEKIMNARSAVTATSNEALRVLSTTELVQRIARWNEQDHASPERAALEREINRRVDAAWRRGATILPESMIKLGLMR